MFAASLHRFPLVLGRKPGRALRGRCCSIQSYRQPTGYRFLGRHGHCCSDVVCGVYHFHRSARLLPSIAGHGPKLHPKHTPPQDRAMVLHVGGKLKISDCKALTVPWLTLVQVIQCFFLSAPMGRNWLYLWDSQHLPYWTVTVLVLVFFVGVWCALLYGVSVYSKSHSWLLPIIAIGLVCPRWCQMLWGVSGIGQYVPWAGSPFGSAAAGRTLWLWLGVLDALQNVGFGQILLHTLTRFHISFTLIAAQVLGSLATIAARGIGPNKLGPGPVFPDFSFGILQGFSHAWFWVGLFAQIAIVLVALRFFRKEQLSKP